MSESSSSTGTSVPVRDAGEWMKEAVEAYNRRKQSKKTSDEDTTEGNWTLPDKVVLRIPRPQRRGTVMSRQLAAQQANESPFVEVELPAHKSVLYVYRTFSQAVGDLRVAAVIYPKGQLVLYGSGRCVHRKFD